MSRDCYWCVRSVSLLVLPLVMLLVALPLHASRVRSISLEEIAGRAERIFVGSCSDVQVVQDPQLGRSVTRITYQVDQVIKGEMGETLVISQIGSYGDPEKRGAGIAGLSACKRGEELLLFLRGDSASGLTSPVGLGQGKFTIYEDKQGRRLAVNEVGNKNLFRGLSDAAKSKLGAGVSEDRDVIALDELLEMVQKLER